MLLLIIATILTILSYIIYEKHKTCFIVGLITSLVGWFVAALGVIPLLIMHFTALSPQYREEIETQLDNVNYRIHYYEITGELPDDLTILIDSYNDMISTGKKYQYSIWVGGIFPDIYDEYEYIEFKVQ